MQLQVKKSTEYFKTQTSQCNAFVKVELNQDSRWKAALLEFFTIQSCNASVEISFQEHANLIQRTEKYICS